MPIVQNSCYSSVTSSARIFSVLVCAPAPLSPLENGLSVAGTPTKTEKFLAEEVADVIMDLRAIT